MPLQSQRSFIIRTKALAGVDYLTTNVELVNRESLEAGYAFGRVVWHDPYPFVDELSDEQVEAGGEAQPAPAAAAAPAANGDARQPRTRVTRRWRRRVSWLMVRMLPDLRWYLLDHHFCVAPFLGHRLLHLRWWERSAILASALGVALWLQFLLEEETSTDTAEAVAELLETNATLIGTPEDRPRVEQRLAAKAETLDVYVGALVVTLWEQLIKLIATPRCTPFTLAVDEDEHAAPRARCLGTVGLTLVGWVGALGVVLAIVAIALSHDRAKTALDAAFAVLNAVALSAAADALTFFFLRREQLSWFGQPSMARAKAYPHGLTCPPSAWLRESRWKYKPLEMKRGTRVPATPPPSIAYGLSFARSTGDASRHARSRDRDASLH